MPRVILVKTHLLLALLCMGLHTAFVDADYTEEHSSQWQDAHYEASSFYFIKHYLTLSIKTLPGNHLQNMLREDREITPDNIQRLTTLIDTPGIRATTSNYFNKSDGLEYSTERNFVKNPFYLESYIKDQTLVLLKREPLPNEARFSDALKWSDLDRTTFKIKGGRQIYSNYLAAFYLLIKGYMTKPGDRVSLDYIQETIQETIQGNIQENLISQLDIVASEFIPIETNYNINNSGGRSTFKHKVTSLKLTISPKNQYSFSFLGLKEDISVYFDIKRHLILKIEGRHPLLGKVQFNLKNLRY